eukprot:c1392_g1_i1.p1 GENE.c1392_g1_i1~~c1392_g1_i1.p1  ORF type:complete len:560 (+),score=124.63 c1392_g1_i1:25-1680(+)
METPHTPQEDDRFSHIDWSDSVIVNGGDVVRQITSAHPGSRINSASIASNVLLHPLMVPEENESVSMLGMMDIRSDSRRSRVPAEHRPGTRARGHSMRENAQMRQQITKRTIANAMGKEQLLQSPPRVRNSLSQPEIDLEVQMDAIGDHRPYFIYAVSLLQTIILVIAMCSGHLAKFGFGDHTISHTVPYFANQSTLVKYEVADNMWFGPDVATTVAFGAKFPPCMRLEPDFEKKQSDQREKDEQSGCCVDRDGNCGMLSESSCESFYSAKWIAGTRCSAFSECKAITLRPCCYHILDDCVVVSREVCDALPAPKVFHDDKELCSEVNCMGAICGMGTLGSRDGTPNQWWRFLTPIFMHVGVGHLFFNMIVQLRIGCDIENVAGFWKMAIMYICSGVGGNILASIMDPDTLSAGASSSIYGLVGVQLVDIMQSWQVIENKTRVLVMIIVQLLLILALGTLPWFDNFAHIGGLIVGIVCGYAVLPYLHFHRKDRITKYLIALHARVLLLILLAVLVILFYVVDDVIGFCKWCRYFNCVPYTNDFCAAVWHKK